MAIKIHPKQADSVIKSLEAGIVPKMGLQHLLVGRQLEIEEIIEILAKVETGQSDLRFWVGDFGSGKSFMLKSIENLALQKNFICSTVDLTPNRRFYANDKKAKALYTEIIKNLSCQAARENALAVVVELFLEKVMEQYSSEYHCKLQDLKQGFYQDEIYQYILQVFGAIQSVGLSYEIGQAVAVYYFGMIENNTAKKIMALRWLSADIETKTEAKKELGIKRIINDENWYDGLKAMSILFKSAGFAGFVLNFDEMVNLYKIPRAETRERNYERILNIYNELKSDVVHSVFINFGATIKSVYDERRGMASYGALKGRLGKQIDATDKLVNTKKTVLQLKPLTTEEIYVLLDKIKQIYGVHYKTELEFSQDEIRLYMEEQLNRPGAAEFLTPRAVIKDFLEILDLSRQNKELATKDLIHLYFGSKPAVQRDSADLDDMTDNDFENIEIF